MTIVECIVPLEKQSCNCILLLGDAYDENSYTTTSHLVLSARSFAKAQLVAKLCENRENTHHIVTKYREMYLSDSTTVHNEERMSQEKLFGVIEQYSATRSYKGLVSAMRTAPIELLLQITRRWLKDEEQLMETALEEWGCAAREVNQETKSVASPVLFEIPAMEREEEYLEPVKKTKPVLLNLPKARTWAHLWQDERRKDSARFLAAYLKPDRNMGHTLMGLMGGAATDDTRINLTNMVVLEGVKQRDTARKNDIGALIKEISAEPLGVLFLERLDFTPISLVRGELVYTLPLTPGEKITVSHKEWSHTSEEYTQEVVEELEKQME